MTVFLLDRIADIEGEPGWKRHCSVIRPDQKPTSSVGTVRETWRKCYVFPKTPSEMIKCPAVNADIDAPLISLVKKHGAILQAHHREWQLSDDSVDANVEVCSVWGKHMIEDRVFLTFGMPKHNIVMMVTIAILFLVLCPYEVAEILLRTHLFWQVMINALRKLCIR